MKIIDYPVKTVPAVDDVLLLVDVHDASQSTAGTTKKVTAGSVAALGGSGPGNVDGGSAVTGQFPAENIDGGNA